MSRGVTLALSLCMFFLAQSVHAETLTLGQSVQDVLMNAVRVDTYTLYLKKNQGLSAFLEWQANSGSLTLGLYDPYGNAISSSISLYKNQTGCLTARIQDTGTYTLKVTSASSPSGMYSLSTSGHWYDPGFPEADIPQHGSYQTAQDFAPGTYQLENAYKQKYIFRLTADPGIAGVITVQPNLASSYLYASVYDSQGYRITSRIMCSNNVPTTVPLTNKSGKLDLYYLVVEMYSATQQGTFALSMTNRRLDGDLDADGLTDARELYYGSNVHKSDTNGNGVTDLADVTAGLDPAARNVAKEVQSAAARASGAIPIASSEYSRFVAAAMPQSMDAAEETWYSFTGVAGETMILYLQAYCLRGAVSASIMNASMQIVASIGSCGYADSQGVAFTPSTTGTCYIRINRGNYASGSYRLSLSKGWANPGVFDCQRSYFSLKQAGRCLVPGFYAIPKLLEAGTYYASGRSYFHFKVEHLATLLFTITPSLNKSSLGFEVRRYSDDALMGSVSSLTDGEPGSKEITFYGSEDYYLVILEGSEAVGGYRVEVTGTGLLPCAGGFCPTPSQMGPLHLLLFE